MINEVYKKINTYDYYEISNLGNIRKIRYDGYLYLSKRTTSNGYSASTLNDRRGDKTYKIHRLVAQAFIPNPENKRTVNHINGIKTDNRVENLEWATHGENMKHSYDFKLRNITQ